MEQKSKSTVDSKQLSHWSISEFLRKLASEEPVPGGGSVAALAGALGAALIVMYSKIGMFRKGISGDDQEVLQKISIEAAAYQQRLTRFITEDSQAYAEVVEAFKLPKGTDDEKKVRQESIQKAFQKAVEAPMQTLNACVECLYLISEVALFGNPSTFSDLKVAEYLCEAGARGAVENIEINLSSIKDPAAIKAVEDRLQKLKQSFDQATKRRIEKPA